MPPASKSSLEEEYISELETLQEYLEETLLQYKKNAASIDETYKKRFSAIYEERRKIVQGKVEPAEEERDNAKEETPAEDKEEDEGTPQPVKGIPGFWLTVLKNQDTISENVKERDEEALKFLEDVRVMQPKGASGYVVEFHFRPNPFFTDSVLVKEVHVPSAEAPISAGVEKQTSPIRWKSVEVNLTLRSTASRASKKQKGSRGKGGKHSDASGGGRGGQPAVRYKSCPSFFNFFSADPRRRGRPKLARRKKDEDDDQEQEGNEEEDEVVEQEEEEEEEGISFADDEEDRFISEQQAGILLAIVTQVVPHAAELYLQGGLGTEADVASGEEALLAQHPPVLRRRIRALLKLHRQREELVVARKAEAAQERSKCDAELRSVFVRRRQLVVGDRISRNSTTATSREARGSEIETEGADDDADADDDGPLMNIPSFWLKVLKGCPMTVELVRRKDEPVLEYLADIRHVAGRDGRSFQILFEFLPNPFFSNALLRKDYTLDSDGEVLTGSRATPIRWKSAEADVTQRPTATGKPKLTPSFFHLFGEGNRALQMLFAGDDRVLLSNPRLVENETSLAVALRDMVVPDALGMLKAATEYALDDDDDDDDDESDDDPSDSGYSEGELDLDKAVMDKVRKRMKGKKKGRGDGGSEAICCGLSQNTILIILLVLPLIAQFIPYIEYWSEFLFGSR